MSLSIQTVFVEIVSFHPECGIFRFQPLAQQQGQCVHISRRPREDWINAQALTGCWIYHYFSCFLFEQFLTTKHLNIWNSFMWKGHESSSEKSWQTIMAKDIDGKFLLKRPN